MDEAQKQEVETVDIVMPEETKPIGPIPQENPQLLHNDIQPQKEELSTGNPHGVVGIKPKGRPCEFCERAVEIETKTNKYLQDCRGKNGSKPTIPFIEEIADILEVDADTIQNWATKKKEDDSLEHPIFFGTIKSVKNYQKLNLLKRTLGRYNAAGAIFQLKANHGLIETEKQLLGNADDKDLRITIVEEEK